MHSQFKTLVEFAEEVERLEASKADYLVQPNLAMRMTDDQTIVLDGEDQVELSVTDYAHGQVADRLKIPRKFYREIGVDHPGLRTDLVNRMVRDSGPERRLVRTMDGQARAFLSETFNPEFDNADMLRAVLPILMERNDISVESSSLSDSRLYLQAGFKMLQGDVTVGDPVRWGFLLRNSEVGNGAFSIEEMLWRLSCLNGAQMQTIMRRVHVGGKLQATDGIEYKRDTIRADAEATRLQLRDTMATLLTREKWEARLDSLREAAGTPLLHPKKALEKVVKKFGLTDDQSELMLDNMATDAGFNQYGLANSITALAHKIDDQDKQYELEKIGGQVLGMNHAQFEVLTRVEDAA